MFKNVIFKCAPRNLPFDVIKRRKSFIKKAIANQLHPRSSPTSPYDHVCQVGDPTLRRRADLIEPELISTKEFKQFIDHLISTMRTYEAYGLSAPQIGTSSQIFVIETTEAQVKECIETKSAGQPVEIVPLTVFINPKMKILDFNTLTYPEACASVYGYIANVSRHKRIQIEALDETGKKFIWEAEGWPARIAQHEMDHLQGKLFTDKMDPKTLSCAIWSIVNEKRGRVGMYFHPKTGKWNSIKKIFT